MAKLVPVMTDLSNMMIEFTRTKEYIELQVTAELILLVTLPFALGALMYAYEALFSPRPAPAA